MLVDTHCHLGDEKFRDDRRETLSRAVQRGVGSAVVVADSIEVSEELQGLFEHTDPVFFSAGVHPHNASSWDDSSTDRIRELAAHDRVVAVGEAGLDYHYDFSPRPIQRKVFAKQIELGEELELPVIVHSRSADEDMVEMIDDAPGTLILHSFSSGDSVFEAAVRGGHYISFSGMITFKSWDRDRLVLDTPDNRLMVETDSPYLAPVPHRGKRNEPAFVVEVASRVAEIRGIDLAVVAEMTTGNASRCFKTEFNGSDDGKSTQ